MKMIAYMVLNIIENEKSVIKKFLTTTNYDKKYVVINCLKIQLI